MQHLLIEDKDIVMLDGRNHETFTEIQQHDGMIFTRIAVYAWVLKGVSFLQTFLK
jgi:hypothetical protein